MAIQFIEGPNTLHLIHSLHRKLRCESICFCGICFFLFYSFLCLIFLFFLSPSHCRRNGIITSSSEMNSPAPMPSRGRSQQRCDCCEILGESVAFARERDSADARARAREKPYLASYHPLSNGYLCVLGCHAPTAAAGLVFVLGAKRIQTQTQSEQDTQPQLECLCI